MEYRDLSRLVARDDAGAGADDDVDAPSRPRGLKFVRPIGRLDVRKIAAAIILAASALGVVFYAGGHALKSAVEWLHKQPQYQLPFDRIELRNPPPDCFRGGTKGFLDRVRANANEAEVLPLLDLDADRIERAFKLFPWVEEVESIDFPPRGLVVGLAYREPAARIVLDAEHEYVLDGHGLILPLDDMDAAKRGRLIEINRKALTAPPGDRVGRIWSTVTDSGEDSPRAALDRAVVQAAKLAGFLLEPSRAAEAAADPALRIFHIHASHPAGLFVQNTEQTLILWGRGPGDEEPDEPSAAEKWEMLARRAKEGGLKLANRKSYWGFTPSGLQRFDSP